MTDQGTHTRRNKQKQKQKHKHKNTLNRLNKRLEFSLKVPFTQIGNDSQNEKDKNSSTLTNEIIRRENSKNQSHIYIYSYVRNTVHFYQPHLNRNNNLMDQKNPCVAFVDFFYLFWQTNEFSPFLISFILFLTDTQCFVFICPPSSQLLRLLFPPPRYPGPSSPLSPSPPLSNSLFPYRHIFRVRRLLLLSARNRLTHFQHEGIYFNET